jgi:hypothetical protein
LAHTCDQFEDNPGISATFSGKGFKPARYKTDFNVDPMSSIICQIEEWTRTPYATQPFECRKVLHVLDEIVLPNSNTVQEAQQFIERVSKYKNLPHSISIKVYGDARGNSRSSKTTRTDYELIKEVFLKDSRFIVTLNQNKANPVVRDCVNTMNNVLCNAVGECNILIDPQCT